MISLAIFVVHVAILGKTLTVREAFLTLSLFNISRFPVNLFSIALRYYAEGTVAVDRITVFLARWENEKKNVFFRMG
jgi:hypothetical protein